MTTNKKITIFLLFFFLLFFNMCYASDVVMDLNTTSSISNTNTITTNEYSTDGTNNIQVPSTSVIENYEDSADLSITNMINIILAVVGVVLILLGIAIIIKIK